MRPVVAWRGNYFPGEMMLRFAMIKRLMALCLRHASLTIPRLYLVTIEMVMDCSIWLEMFGSG